MKDKKILKELRKGPMKSMKDDEYAMIEKEVDEKGIAGLKGYAKSMIEKAMRDMAYSMKKAEVSTLKKKQKYLSTVATTKILMARGQTESTAQMTPKAKMAPSQRTLRVQKNFIPMMMTQKKNTKNWMPMTQDGWMTWTS